VEYHPPLFSFSSSSFFSFFLGFSCNGLLWFLPLLSGFFSVFGFLVFLPCSLLFVLPCRRVSFPSSILFFPRFFSRFSSLFIPCFFLFVLLSGKKPQFPLFFLASLFSFLPLPFWCGLSLAFYRARTYGCSPVRLFFPGRRISLRVLVFCWDLDTRFYPYLLGL